MMAVEEKGHTSERKPCEKATPPHPSLAGISKSSPVSSPEPKSDVTGNLASGMDDLLPSELYDPEVESKVADRFSKMSDDEFSKLLKTAEFHPDFATYVRGVKVELGSDDDVEWMFGRDGHMRICLASMFGASVGNIFGRGSGWGKQKHQPSQQASRCTHKSPRQQSTQPFQPHPPQWLNPILP